MTFVRHGQRADVNLTDLKGDLVALQYQGEAENISFTLPEEGPVTRTVTRARVFTFLPDGSKGEYLGESLVFPQIIARELRADPKAWHIGVLTQTDQKGRTDRSVYTLEAPAGDREAQNDVFSRAETEITNAGMA